MLDDKDRDDTARRVARRRSFGALASMAAVVCLVGSLSGGLRTGFGAYAPLIFASGTLMLLCAPAVALVRNPRSPRRFATLIRMAMYFAVLALAVVVITLAVAALVGQPVGLAPLAMAGAVALLLGLALLVAPWKAWRAGIWD